MLLPVKSKNPPESFPFATVALILVNVIVYAATSNGLLVYDSVAKNYGLSPANASVLTYFSHMFLHGDLFHIIGNMWFLYLFGFAVEGRIRTPKFLLLYLLSGLAGGGLHVLLAGAGADVPMIGASGAIMGVLGAALYLFPHSLVVMFYWLGWFFYGAVDWRTYWVAALYLGLDALYLFLERSVGMADGVAHLAHLGGAGAGVLICLILRAKRDSLETSDAKAMYSELKDMRYLSVRELASMAQANPDNTTVLLNWAASALHDQRGMSEECRQAFLKALPKITERESAQTVGYVLAGMANAGIPASSSVMVGMASRIERTDDARNAFCLYEAVLNAPDATDADLEVAYFRMGMLNETRFANPQAAVESYLQVARRFPMGAFGDQARMRLTALGYRDKV